MLLMNKDFFPSLYYILFRLIIIELNRGLNHTEYTAVDNYIPYSV